MLLWNDYGRLFLERLLLAMHPTAILDIDDDLGAARVSRVRSAPRSAARRASDEVHGEPQDVPQGDRRKPISRGAVLERGPQLDRDDVTVIPTCVDYEDEPAKATALALVLWSSAGSEAQGISGNSIWLFLLSSASLAIRP